MAKSYASQKVYQIGGSKPKGPDASHHAGRKVIDFSPRRYSTKNPSTAALFSAFLWGSGQAYADFAVMGLKYLLLQCVTVVLYAALWFHSEAILAWQKSSGFAEIKIIYAGVSYALMIALIWFFQVAQAYRMTSDTRLKPYPGSDSFFAVMTASFLLPGGGQMVNAEPRKGLLLMIAPGLFFGSLIASFTGVSFWPFLETTQSRAFVEGIWGVTALLGGLQAFVWLIAFYDAMLVYQFPEIREPFLHRAKLGWNRFRIALRRGKVWDSLQEFSRHLMMLVIALGVMAALITLVPASFYLKSLNAWALTLRSEKLLIIPDLLQDFHQFLSHFLL